jgi:hydroxybutyrate-dimer hydrolase
MTASRLLNVLPLAAAVALSSCAGAPAREASEDFLVSPIGSSRHADGDDLLTAGLGAAGLRSPVPPAFVDAQAPTAAELRRRAIWSNWRGIADLVPGGGYGEVYGSLAPVPGREFTAFARIPGAKQPHRVLVQLPDSFDVSKRCLVVTVSSGSRGIYGAIALAGSWGLSHGCAVAYTDKGAGTGFVDSATGSGARLDGTRGAAGEGLEFDAPVVSGDAPPAIASKHANSGDNPEADWGRHVRQAAEFGLRVLESELPGQGPFTFANTRVIAVGVSNGGGAVLRSAELDGDWLDGVVAISPNISPGQGGRALYDYGTEAAIWQPCALNAPAFDAVPLARPGGAVSSAGVARCASLQAAGLLDAGTPAQQAEQARQKLHGLGWSDEAIAAGAISTAFDLWRAVNVTYASSYARTGANEMPCGYRFQAMDAKGAVHSPSAAEQAAWWSDSSGIPPGAGVGIVDTMAAGSDPFLPGLQCLRALWIGGDDPMAQRVRKGVAETRAQLPARDLPILVIHGAEDGLVPEAFSGGAYAAWAKRGGAQVSYWKVDHAQHFDAFLGLPPLAARYVPLLPYAYRGLDQMWAHISTGAPLPADAHITPTPRGTAPLRVEDLKLP